MDAPDPVALAQSLIRCRSVTPADGGALDLLDAALRGLGFVCRRLPFEAPGTARIDNLYARLGTGAPHFCFAGHTDVVPPGDLARWRCDPFGAEIRDGVLYGRGAVDMKSAIAAFVAAIGRHGTPSTGSISLLITGDEEGPGINGTSPVLAWLKDRGEIPDHCLVGEPTSAARSGDTIKIGRRGSLQARFTARGIQGHTAYPQTALNPIPLLAELVAQLAREPLDGGTAEFEPSTIAFTTFDVGNPASNVSPAEARAAANIRFNDLHSPQSLRARLDAAAHDVCRRLGGEIAVECHTGGAVFLTRPGPFVSLLSGAIASVTHQQPALSTGGGTSDARFIKDYCPVAELGLPGVTMHKSDECIPLDEIHRLSEIYAAVLDAYFKTPPL